MDKRELKQFVTAEVKMGDGSGHGSIEGYANVKGNVDSYGDRVVDGAYLKLDELVKNGFAAQGHEWYELGIGTITEAREDAKGLYVKMDFHSDEKSQRIRTVCKERIERGKSVAFSIGYFTKEWSYIEEDGQNIRLLKGIEVFEVSIVTVPANNLSLATSAKAKSGSSLADHCTAVVADVRELAARMEEVKTLRAEKGKGLSDERKGDLEVIRGFLAESLQVVEGALTDDKSKGHDAPNEDNSIRLEMPLFW